MNTTQRTAQEQIQAMAVIVNLQMMEEKISGRRPEYKEYKRMSLEELHELQEQKIKEYNNTFKA